MAFHRFAKVALAGLLASALAGGCNPYDPDLGETPFRCGTNDPKCPDGYQCIEYSPSEKICERGGDPGAPDGGGDGSNLTCNDDSMVEPNNDTSQAWTTPIPDFAPDIALVSLAICPSTDKDLFRFRVDQTGKNMRATITTDVSAGQLVLQVLNGGGASISSGTPTSATEISVVVNNLAIGTYYVQVSAPEGVENNYTLDIVTCDVSGCP